jgi:hypothetical protein
LLLALITSAASSESWIARSSLGVGENATIRDNPRLPMRALRCMNSLDCDRGFGRWLFSTRR